MNKNKIISFLTDQLSLKNVNAFTVSWNSLHSQSQERRSVNKNLFSDNTESDLPRKEGHIVKINKTKNVVTTGDCLLNRITEKGLSRNDQVVLKIFG